MYIRDWSNSTKLTNKIRKKEKKCLKYYRKIAFLRRMCEIFSIAKFQKPIKSVT